MRARTVRLRLARYDKWYLKAMAVSVPILLLVAVVLASYITVQMLSPRGVTPSTVGSLLRPVAQACATTTTDSNSS